MPIIVLLKHGHTHTLNANSSFNKLKADYEVGVGGRAHQSGREGKSFVQPVSLC